MCQKTKNSTLNNFSSGYTFFLQYCINQLSYIHELIIYLIGTDDHLTFRIKKYIWPLCAYFFNVGLTIYFPRLIG